MYKRQAEIRLTRHKEPPVKVQDPALMFKLIRASFNQRRKTLQNGLNNSPEISFSKEQIAAGIESLGVSPTIRGEALKMCIRDRCRAGEKAENCRFGVVLYA